MIHTCLNFAPIQLPMFSSVNWLSGNRQYVLQTGSMCSKQTVCAPSRQYVHQTLIFVLIFLVQHDKKGLYNEYRLLLKKQASYSIWQIPISFGICEYYNMGMCVCVWVFWGGGWVGGRNCAFSFINEMHWIILCQIIRHTNYPKKMTLPSCI
jgi:hypothetical protein